MYSTNKNINNGKAKRESILRHPPLTLPINLSISPSISTYLTSTLLLVLSTQYHFLFYSFLFFHFHPPPWLEKELLIYASLFPPSSNAQSHSTL
jgi:hypothetical protein